MEFEFDKEMDSLLRQTAKGENVFAAENPAGEHIDADEISMFAENALPEKVKPYVIKHLADCDKCRTILSNTILLNTEAEKEESASIPVRETKAEKVVIGSAIPWYKSLFSTRNLAFGTGALALIFAVGIGFLFLQSSTNSEMQTAQANTNSADFESAPNLEKTDSEEMSDADETSMNTNAKSLSEVENSDANIDADSANISSTNKNQLKDSDKKENKRSGDDFAKNKFEVAESPDVKGNISDDEVIMKEKDAVTADSAKLEDLSTNARNPQPMTTSPPPPSAPSVMAKRSAERLKKSENRNESSRQAEPPSDADTIIRRISGKTFNLKENVWYDSAYKGQATINVRRGTEQYKELDSGLRSIGDKLSGAVVVVWKSKAYQIQ